MKVSEAFKKAFRGEDVESSTPEVSAENPTIAKMLLLTQEGCHGCDLAKEYLKEEIDDGSVELCPLSDERCSKIANELHLRETPSIVSIDGDGVHHKCDIKTDGDDFMIECPVTEGGNGAAEEVVEEQAPPPKHGKLGITCISPDVKHQLGWWLQSQPDLPPDILPLVGSLPECGNAEDGMPIPLGFSEVKKSGGTATKPASARSAFMKKCLSGKTGELQPLRMKRCSEEWRNLSEKEKKQYS